MFEQIKYHIFPFKFYRFWFGRNLRPKCEWWITFCSLFIPIWREKFPRPLYRMRMVSCKSEIAQFFSSRAIFVCYSRCQVKHIKFLTASVGTLENDATSIHCSALRLLWQIAFSGKNVANKNCPFISHSNKGKKKIFLFMQMNDWSRQFLKQKKEESRKKKGNWTWTRRESERCGRNQNARRQSTQEHILWEYRTDAKQHTSILYQKPKNLQISFAHYATANVERRGVSKYCLGFTKCPKNTYAYSALMTNNVQLQR